MSLASLALMALSLVVSGAMPAMAQDADPFVVGGVEVDVEAGDSVAAREDAFRIAQRDALVELFRRLGVADRIGPDDLNTAESAGVMQSLRVEDESTTPGNYRAVFEVTFREEAVRAVLASRGIEPGTPDPGSLADGGSDGEETAGLDDGEGAVWLIIPVWRDGGGTRLWDAPNPWLAAWLEVDAAESPIELAVPLADLEDIRTLSTNAAVAADGEAVAQMAERYQAGRALVAVANAGVGGVVIELLLPGGRAALEEPLSLTGETDEPQVMRDAVAAVLSEIVGREVELSATDEEEDVEPTVGLAPLSPNTPGSRMALTVLLSQPRDWLSVRSTLASVGPVTGAAVTSLSGTTVRLELAFTGSEAELAALLRERGLDLRVTQQGRVLQRLQ